MDFIEKDLGDIIWETQQTNEGRKLLSEKGLEISGKTFRHLYLGEYGTCNLLTLKFIDKYPIITIYELKQKLIDVNTLMQACVYLKGVKQWVDYHYNYDCDVDLILIGKEIQINGDLLYLYNELSFVKILTYEIDINGFKFKEASKGWHKTYEEKLFNIEKINIGFSELRKICLFTDTPF